MNCYPLILFFKKNYSEMNPSFLPLENHNIFFSTSSGLLKGVFGFAA